MEAQKFKQFETEAHKALINLTGIGHNHPVAFFVLGYENTSDETNPPVEALQVRSTVVDPMLEADDEGYLTQKMDLADTSIPINSRLAMAAQFIWDQVGQQIMNDSPAIRGLPLESVQIVEKAGDQG